MKQILDKDEIRELLYNEYRINKELLEPKQIEEKGIVNRNILKKVFGKLDTNTIWQDVAEYYNYDIPTKEENDKLDLIRRLKEVAKIEGEPVNSKLHRDLYCKGCKLFGSWRELCMSAEIKVSNIRTATLQNNNNRKDEILEKLMILACKNKEVFKSTLKKYKNMPSYESIEKLYNCKWDNLINILQLDLKDLNKYKYISNKEFLQNISNKIKENNIKSLTEYSFKDETIPFIYVIDKMAINWEWFNVLKKNNFSDCNSEKFKYTKEELFNILSFKCIVLSRHLSSVEINNDITLPNVMEIMKIFNKNIYEVWVEVEKNKKYKL